MNGGRKRIRVAVALTAFAVLFTCLTVSSFTQKSATWDEYLHLTAGYAALKNADYRFSTDHPPFLRKWCALPLMMMAGVNFSTSSDDLLLHQEGQCCYDFLYRLNDTERLLYPARFMTVLLGILLGILLFSWANELFGFWPSVVVLALYSLEPNILAHSSLVTTDFGVTCFFFGAIYFLWRTTQRITIGNLLGFIAFLALAILSKHSALLLGPIVLGLLVVHVCRRSSWPYRLRRSGELSSRPAKVASAAAILVALAIGCYLAVWASYGFQYPILGAQTDFRYPMPPSASEHASPLIVAAKWMDQHRLLPNAYALGFVNRLMLNTSAGTFLAGEHSSQGWWYFFPVVYLIKGSTALVLLTMSGLFVCAVQRKALLGNDAFILLPFVFYLLAAMMGRFQIGVRHILPIFPLALLLSGKAVVELVDGALGRGRHQKQNPKETRAEKSPLLPHSARMVLMGLLGALAVYECAHIHPHYLAFFNLFVGGPRNGYKYLCDSNLDWGQDLKLLKKWMDNNGVRHINLSYYGTADPTYYRINCTRLPGCPWFFQGGPFTVSLPGYVAVSVSNLHGMFDEKAEAFYRPLLERVPEAIIGYSIRVYWVDRPWW